MSVARSFMHVLDDSTTSSTATKMKMLKNMLLEFNDAFTMHHNSNWSCWRSRDHRAVARRAHALIESATTGAAVAILRFCGTSWRRLSLNYTFDVEPGGNIQCLHGAFLSNGSSSRMATRLRWIVIIVYIYTRRNDWKQFRCSLNRNSTILKICLNKH